MHKNQSTYAQSIEFAVGVTGDLSEWYIVIVLASIEGGGGVALLVNEGLRIPSTATYLV